MSSGPVRSGMSEATGVDVLFASGVLSEADDEVSLTGSFESAVDEYEPTVNSLSREGRLDWIAGTIGDAANADPLAELGKTDPRTLADLRALADHVDGNPSTWLPLIPVLRLFRADPGEMEGVPTGFIPVPGDHLPHYARIYSALIVYVWLEDCPPCDTLRGRLGSMVERLTGILPFAVYGPDYAPLLEHEYGVTAGPAMLFMKDGRVDTRLYGDQADRIVEREIERLRE